MLKVRFSTRFKKDFKIIVKLGAPPKKIKTKIYKTVKKE